MPYDEPSSLDPHVLVGVGLPGNEETTREMAYAFAEEFAGLGYDEESLFRIFQDPGYAGAHKAYVELGGEEVRTIVRECVSVWGGFRVTVQDHPDAGPEDEVGLCEAEPFGKAGGLLQIWNGDRIAGSGS